MAEYRQLLAAYEKVFEISGAEASDHLELEVIGDMGLDCRAARLLFASFNKLNNSQQATVTIATVARTVE
ncbi:hypothetical protein BGZ59_008615 [Podila verticillata]|nr:hypothetical protein BGZ59_008615 [Podila verticillata]